MGCHVQEGRGWRHPAHHHDAGGSRSAQRDCEARTRQCHGVQGEARPARAPASGCPFSGRCQEGQRLLLSLRLRRQLRLQLPCRLHHVLLGLPLCASGCQGPCQEGLPLRLRRLLSLQLPRRLQQVLLRLPLCTSGCPLAGEGLDLQLAVVELVWREEGQRRQCHHHHRGCYAGCHGPAGVRGRHQSHDRGRLERKLHRGAGPARPCGGLQNGDLGARGRGPRGRCRGRDGAVLLEPQRHVAPPGPQGEQEGGVLREPPRPAPHQQRRPPRRTSDC
mmetsp:Transcript_5824/g.22213  ORF Transcript_5824/g.22213 Transcript_5824/m.22213 type:complete len:276 (+) Transcript_5824:62-889(+)